MYNLVLDRSGLLQRSTADLLVELGQSKGNFVKPESANIICLTALICFFSGGLAGAADGLAAKSDNTTFKLEGGIEHSEKLPPVEKAFRPGSKLREAESLRANPDNHWYQIPEWAAGTWTSVQSTRTYARDLRSGRELQIPESKKTNMQFSWGFQKDKLGHVWEYAKEPYTLTLDSSDHRVIKRILKRDFVKANDAQVVLRLLTENIVVNKSTDKIIRTAQVENIQICVPSPDECMTCTASYKIFDEHGTPVELGKETNISKRVALFKNIDDYEGKNMPKLFTEFLSAEGRLELID